MRILLDTHAIIEIGMDKVSESRKLLLSDPMTEVLVSAFSFWEIAKLVELKRIELDESVAEYIARIEHNPSIRVIPIDSKVIAALSVVAPKMHPADQMIVASAIAAKAYLLTDDRLIRKAELVEVV